MVATALDGKRRWTSSAISQSQSRIVSSDTLGFCSEAFQ
jgi:hypothetical protein